jgi:uncharacterized protein DUF4126
METLYLIGTATGLGFLAGIRLYATILTLGLAIRFHLIHLRPEFENLAVLADWWVIGLAGVAFLLEFVADKVPWVDSAWDAVHTFIRPVGAAFIALTAMGDVSPFAQVAVVLLTGSAALTSHSMKAATRLAVNQSPEPVSNSLVSLAGDVAVPIGVWVAMEHPLIIGGFVAASMLVFLLVAPKIFRLLRIQLGAMSGLSRGIFRTEGGPVGSDALPEQYADYLTRELGQLDSPTALRAVAGKGVDGLKHSTGYLILQDDEVVFVTRRWFRYRLLRFPAGGAEIEHNFRKGMLLDKLAVTTSGRTRHFSLFKGAGADNLWEPATS